jgi:hypothetical protein
VLLPLLPQHLSADRCCAAWMLKTSAGHCCAQADQRPDLATTPLLLQRLAQHCWKVELVRVQQQQP